MSDIAIAPVLGRINDAIINPAIAVLFIVALAVFIWGVVRFIANNESEEERTRGKKNMLYGIIGMFIMIAVFFIMEVIVNTFGFTTPGGDDPAGLVQ